MALARQVRVTRERLTAGRLPALSLTVLALTAGLGVAACGNSPAKAASVVHCGTTESAANVPVSIDVVHGKVACSEALTIERGYAKAIRQGKAPGNGGGGPINVTGWICQGFNAPQVVKTGNASKCNKAGTEILAVLKLTK
jgi:hypothetical protein